jgi:hypothetical protein
MAAGTRYLENIGDLTTRNRDTSATIIIVHTHNLDRQNMLLLTGFTQISPYVQI